MFLLQPRFWSRVLLCSLASTVLAFAAATRAGGGWGPCGPSDGWGFYLALVGLLSVAVAALAALNLMLASLPRLMRRKQHPVCRR
jgi:hypothetical protein